MKKAWLLVMGGLLAIVILAAFVLPKIINKKGDVTSASAPSSQPAVTEGIVNTWINVCPAVIREDKAASATVAQKLTAAITASGLIPEHAQVTAVADEITRMSDRWQKYYGQQLSATDWGTTLQHKTYYYLHPARMTAQEVAVRDQQHKELMEIMERLPQRMLKEWGVPIELGDEVIRDHGLALGHYESLLKSDFSRCSQVPLDANEFVRLKERMNQEIDRLGKSLSESIHSNEQQWKSSLPKVQPTLPEKLGADLLDQQRSTYRQFLTFFYGMAAREFVLPQMRTVKDTFPWGEQDSYGVSYRLNSGWVVWIHPKK